MSAHTEIKITAGHTYRTITGRTLRVIKVEGWRVTYVVVTDSTFGGVQTTSYVDFAIAVVEDVTP